jgi:hypothetical protein
MGDHDSVTGRRHEDITCGHESITGRHESLNCLLKVFNR